MPFSFLKKKEYKNYNLIEGFLNPNLISSISTNYIINKLNMEQIGFFDNDAVPIVKIEHGIAVHPTRVYADKKNKLIAVISDQIIQGPAIKKYARSLIKWCKKTGIKRIISLNGVESDDEKILGASNSQKNLSFLLENKIELLQSGLTAGITAELFIQEKNYPIYLLLASYKKGRNYEASAKLIHCLNRIIKLNIDTGPLEKEAKILEKQLNKHKDNIQNNTMYV